MLGCPMWSVCARRWGRLSLALYLLHRLFVYPHNRRVLMRMEWMPWVLKLSQLMASQYQASHQHMDHAHDETELRSEEVAPRTGDG